MKDFANLHIDDYFRVFWKRRSYFIFTAVFVTAAVTLIAWRLPNVYKSETTILVEPLISEAYVRPTVSDRLENRLDLFSQQVRSRTLLERLIQEYRLYGYGTRVPFFMEDAVKQMKQDIEINIRLRNTFSLTYLAPDPYLARDITKRLAEEIIQSQTSSRKEQAVGTDQFIDEQLRQAQKDLSVHEERLKAFKLQHLGALPEQSAGNLAALNTLNNQLIANDNALQRAQDQRLLVEQRMQELRRLNNLSSEILQRSGGKESGALSRTDARAALRTQLDSKRTQLADMTSKYTDRHPDVLKLMREVQDLERRLSQSPSRDGSATASGDGSSVASSVTESDLQSLQTQLESYKRESASRQKEHDEIQSQIRVYQSRLNLSPRVEQELLSLTRAYDGLKQNYDNLRSKKFDTQVAANLEMSKQNETFKVIDEASLPEQPVKPNRRLIAFLGLLGGIALGLGMCFAVEYFDPTLSDEDQASMELNLPILVSIPEITTNGIPSHKTAERKVRLAG